MKELYKMRYLLLILTLFIGATSCDQKPPAPVMVSSDDKANTLYNRAMQIVDSTTYYVKENQAKRMGLKKTNKLLKPLAAELDSITNLLSPLEQTQIKEYRIKQANLIIDEMVQKASAKHHPK